MLPTAVAVPIPDAIEPTLSLTQNARRVLEARLSQRLSDAEARRVDEALAEAISVLQAGNADAQRRLLTTESMAAALLQPSVAMLWASIAESAEHGGTSVAAFCAAVTNTTATIAGALFAASFGE